MGCGVSLVILQDFKINIGLNNIVMKLHYLFLLLLAYQALAEEIEEANAKVAEIPENNSVKSLRRSCYGAKKEEAKVWMPEREGGVFDIYLEATGKSIEVFCDLKESSDGWLVIQRRVDGSVDFERDWDDYVNGFGTIEGEFWLGLENIHYLTSVEPQELYVYLAEVNGGHAYTQYSTFSVGDAASKYQLTISGYSGTAQDSLIYSNQATFSTRDQDNDSWSSNCALCHRGGWWYKHCAYSNLNGYYYPGGYFDGESCGDGPGIRWQLYTMRNPRYSLTNVEMKIRPTS